MGVLQKKIIIYILTILCYFNRVGGARLRASGAFLAWLLRKEVAARGAT